MRRGEVPGRSAGGPCRVLASFEAAAADSNLGIPRMQRFSRLCWTAVLAGALSRARPRTAPAGLSGRDVRALAPATRAVQGRFAAYWPQNGLSLA